MKYYMQVMFNFFNQMGHHVNKTMLCQNYEINSIYLLGHLGPYNPKEIHIPDCTMELCLFCLHIKL